MYQILAQKKAQNLNTATRISQNDYPRMGLSPSCHELKISSDVRRTGNLLVTASKMGHPHTTELLLRPSGHIHATNQRERFISRSRTWPIANNQRNLTGRPRDVEKD
ncbi:hypothetical protein VTN49DRAFT_7028 [Thermomyces lanuginosus]|uniref:uncharacterized protein n=1 Tax=Thermomyces lanuginosus TaxID=5541 RepID=UPI003742A1B4